MRLTFKSDDFAGWVHNGTVCRDGPADGRVWIAHVNDDHLRLFAHLLPDTDEFIRLHCEGAEPNVCWVYARVLELVLGKTKLDTVWAQLHGAFC